MSRVTVVLKGLLVRRNLEPCGVVENNRTTGRLRFSILFEVPVGVIMLSSFETVRSAATSDDDENGLDS